MAVAGPRVRTRLPARGPEEEEDLSLPTGEPQDPPSHWGEPGQMLRELDALTEELLPRRDAPEAEGPAPPARAPEASPPTERSEPEPTPTSDSQVAAKPPETPDWQEPEAEPTVALAAPPVPSGGKEAPGFAPTLYLEERLRLANLGLLGFSKGVRDLDSRWSSLRERAEELQKEIERAQRELEFVRTTTGAPFPASEARPTAAPLPTRASLPAPEPAVTAATEAPRATARVWSTGRIPPAPRVQGRPLPGPFGEFTAARYNRTIGDLKSRRKKLAGYTLLFAVLISIGLLILTAIVREPTPPWWIAVLPAIWMVPVPFFIASFRGTQRVLRRNHLELAGD